MLEYLGQRHWWCPDHVEQLARDVAPGLKSMRGKLEAPIREAATEIRKFLDAMLGEHAAAVALALATHASVVRPSHTTVGQRQRGGHDTASHAQVGSQARIQGKKTEGKIASTVQKTAWDVYQPLTNSVKGLLGEHVAEHYVIEKKNWGLQWNKHDMIAPTRGNVKGGWQSEHRKLNDGEIPAYLCSPSTSVLGNGIDSLWFTNRQKPHRYAVVEAKTRMSPRVSLYEILDEAEKTNWNSRPGGSRSRPRESKRSSVGQGEKGKKPNRRIMQMSHDWIRDRIVQNFSDQRGKIFGNYSRHVLLVTPLQLAEHLNAMEKIIENGLIGNPTKAQKYAELHSEHNIHKEFKESELDEAENEYMAKGPYRPKK